MSPKLADCRANSLQSFPMTTGSRGLHISVPLDAKQGFNRVRDFARDVAHALTDAYPGVVTTAQQKKARGGKLILYHGWSDAAISPLNAIDYYRSVQAKMGTKADGFVRLFMVPGMQHCGGGPGPSVFGQNGDGPGDPERDIHAALKQWVEGGTAPAWIVATKYKSPGVVERTRPLCPYPQTAHYKGSGSTDDAANFLCR